MNLLQPLVLPGAKTEDLSMVPTKEFFKPVLVIVAPLTRENAILLRCEYLYDPAGNPHHFEGTHRPEGELSGAALVLAGTMVPAVEFKTEKVAHFGIFRVEKKGLSVRMRAHLPETGEEDLVKLFRFLSTLNKEGYTVTVTDAQGSLYTTLSTERGDDVALADPGHHWPLPDPHGVYGPGVCTVRPFQAKKLTASVMTVQVGDEQFLWGWMLESHFKSGVLAYGSSPNVRDIEEGHVAPVVQTAVEHAVKCIRERFLELKPQTDPERKASGELDAFLLDLADLAGWEGPTDAPA